MTTDFDKYATKHKSINSNTYGAYKNHVSSMLNPMAMTPMIVEEKEMNVAVMSVFDRLMAERIIFLGMPIDDVVANVVNAQLLYLESVDKSKPIQIYINSPGGSVYDGLGIYDVMKHVTPKIGTANTGLAASMAFILMISGDKGLRASLPHSSASSPIRSGLLPGKRHCGWWWLTLKTNTTAADPIAPWVTGALTTMRDWLTMLLEVSTTTGDSQRAAASASQSTQCCGCRMAALQKRRSAPNTGRSDDWHRVRAPAES